MSRNTLYSLMKIFSRTEIKELKDRFRTQKTEYRTCFNLLCKNLKAVKNDTLSKEDLFAMVFPGEPFNDSKIRHLKSDMCRLLEEYLVEKELKTDEKTHQELLARALFRRNDYDLFTSTVKKRLNKLEELPHRGKAYFQEKAHHFRWLFLHAETEVFDKDNTWQRDYNEYLQHYFAIANLEVEADRFIAKRHLDLDGQTVFADPCIAFSEANNHNQVLRLFSALFQLYLRNQPTPEKLNDLKNYLGSNLHRLGDIEKRMALKLLSNFPVRMLNKGEHDYSAFIFELFKKGADEGLLVNLNGQFNAGHFVNIFITACKNGEFEWAESLFKQYEPLLPEKDRQIVTEVCRASFLYQKAIISKSQADYLKVLKHTPSSPNRNHWRYNFRQRSMTVRVYYELFLFTKDYGEELERQLKNFDSYLHKNTTLVPELPQGYLKFNSHLRNLYRLAANPDTTKSQLNKFRQKLDADENVHLRHWLKNAAERLSQTLRH